MAEYDLVLRGGTVIEGTGVPRYRADLAIKDGRIAKVSGHIPAGGATELDAGGCIVAPGAINLHTHYDAQLNWDPYATLDGWFGQTTMTIGQCGFGFAPTRPEDRDLNMRMMNRIEAIPLDSMRKGMRWDWETYPEYLDSLDRQGLGVNVGSLLPFCSLRGYVLGMIAARERTSVTDKELNRMKELFHEGMKAGSFGFAIDRSEEDRCEDGSPIPTHMASEAEVVGLAEVLGGFGVGMMGWTMIRSVNHDAQERMVSKMLRASGRPLHVVLDNNDRGPEWYRRCREEGLPIAPQKTPLRIAGRWSLAEYNLFDYMPSWVDPLVGTAAVRAEKLRAPGVRDAMRRDVEAQPDSRTDWDSVRVLQVVHERNYPYEGKSMRQVAEMMGKHPVDALLDLALDEDLATEFSNQESYEDAGDLAGKIADLCDPSTHISTSDGGAHTRFQANARWVVDMLAYWIRDKEIMSLEQGHYKMSAYPAWIAGYTDRGTLTVGRAADIMVYDLGELGVLNEDPVYSNDFPGGERRLIQKPKGLRYTLVNGAVTFEENECTGALPGKLLRSYDMAR